MDTHEVITAARPADEAAGQPSTLAVLPTALVIVMYLVLGIVAFWPVYPRNLSTSLQSRGGLLTVRVVSRLDTACDRPWPQPVLQQFDIRADRSESGPEHGEPFTRSDRRPFAPVLSPLVRANALMLLAMPASATAAFVVLRKWKVWGPAAALGGLIYGFSPYMVGQGLGHVVFIFVAAAAVHRADGRLHHAALGITSDGSGSSSAFWWWPSTSSHPRYWRK